MVDKEGAPVGNLPPDFDATLTWFAEWRAGNTTADAVADTKSAEEGSEAEASAAKVAQRQGRPLLRMWGAADDEEEVDEDLDEPAAEDAETSTAPAGDEGEEILY